ncbi:MAG: hypothetical protein KJP18_07250 [Gemmatimonadetes bacterium]|nr:hypothetical protein [Gemmatimonadota bacterium]NNF37154.1 hypothetical protein [Gemmatimonadota bacterium]
MYTLSRAPSRRIVVPIAWFTLALAVGGCASSGEPEPPPVPVFFSTDEVPCAYEVMGLVREEVIVERDMDRVRRSALGRAGARRGADAVLVEGSERFRVERMDMARRDVGPQRISIEGDLLRYTDATCR